ncbi:hypothetical protein ACQKGC_04125 [Allorhizobium pseudoryzae]|uniref:hypothetical protein n=1 Tax=Allorhizobium pseudoryzae TaxID=379684 RepID=UPI003CFD2BE0
MADNKKNATPEAEVRKDAKGQFVGSQADRSASGVASAKPTVVTGSEDATAHKKPPEPASDRTGD